MCQQLLPDSQQKISYGIPTFYNKNGFIVYIAGYENFVSIYPVHFATKLIPELKPYLSGKSTARFSHDKPLPKELIKQLIKALEQKNLERKS